MLTEDVLQPYTEGLEIKTDDQRLVDVSAEFLSETKSVKRVTHYLAVAKGL